MNTNSFLFASLASLLFFGTFGLYGLLIAVSGTICFVFGFVFVVYTQGWLKLRETERELKRIMEEDWGREGHEELLEGVQRTRDTSACSHSAPITPYPHIDRIIDEIMEYTMRDFVDPWYKQMTDDELFRQSLVRTMRRTMCSLSHCMRDVDWVPLVTRHLTDDFASHLRLYRIASEKSAASESKEGTTGEDLESHFFDLELEMEKNLCRDLLSTTPHYENAYLHDLVDILLYLLMPLEDFRCRPLRFLLREVLVKRIISPTLDHLSNPNNVNELIVWLLSDISPRTEDLVAAVDMSESTEELEALVSSIREQLLVLRGKDAGGEHGEAVKAQMASLEYLENVVKRKEERLSTETIDRGMDAGLVVSCGDQEEELIDLPLLVVLNNSIAVSFLMQFLSRVGGHHYLDLYLAIEGFKVSVEHQLRYLANGEMSEYEVRETVKEAVQFMYQQYLSEEAITRVPIDESLVKQLMNRRKKEEPSDEWFNDIQEYIMDVLKKEERFYPAFKKDELYVTMLHELGVMGGDERSQSIASSLPSPLPSLNGNASDKSGDGSELIEKGTDTKTHDHPLVTVVVETLGIGQQGKQSFALYNLRVSRTVNGRKVSGWNVLRRYSDFHLLHSIIIQKYPDLTNLSFPGKKTFNNLSAQFLEKRTKALNDYMTCILQPSMISSHMGLDKIVFDFLSQKEYTVKGDAISKKMMNAMFDPIRSGVRAVTSAVTAVPDQVAGGVSRVGDGINNAINIIRPISSSSLPKDTDRVASSLSTATTSESIPLRLLLLLVDEVFGMRARQAWIRRQLVTLLRQLVTPLGTSINKRIISVVHWLSSQEQVTVYLAAIRDCVWPNGRLSPPSPPRPTSFHHRTRILLRTLTLSALPEQLRLILGNETTNQGIKGVCNALQRPHLNRRLLYVFIERLLIAIFPKNRFEKIFAQLHSKSPRTKRV